VYALINEHFLLFNLEVINMRIHFASQKQNGGETGFCIVHRHFVTWAVNYSDIE
jgi:hypothetical protein